MVRIAPVRLSFNPRTLWFDAGDLDLHVNDKVVVSTARGDDFGTVSSALFDLDEEGQKKLKSPLKPVKRVADENDVARAKELADLNVMALPIFKQIAAESVPEMNPIAVEYLFEGDKAVFYFESEERVDFRDLVRKLASEFHVRVDMKQIGVRDEARLVGGLGHCGQELCCRRLGGGFDPVSIRMAKEQDLSLNPQKISGVCGRLMCCLRYEYEAYKDFHGRAPKKNAKIQTPDGEGKVVDMNVPREIISVKVGDEKPVKIPLADFDEAEEGTRPNTVGEEAWQRANEPAVIGMESALSLFTNQLSGEDKLAEPGKVRHVHGEDEPEKPSRSRRRRSRGSSSSSAQKQERQRAAEPAQQTSQRKPRRRRSTTVGSDGETKVVEQGAPQQAAADEGKAASSAGGGRTRSAQGKEGSGEQRKGSSRRRPRNRSGNKQGQGQQGQVQQDQVQRQAKAPAAQQKASKVGRNSSALRANRPEGQSGQQERKQQETGEGAATSTRRRRRRSHKTSEEKAE